MQLLTKGLEHKLPKLYQTEHTPVPEKLALAKFFHPVSGWEWYPIEYDGVDTFFGLVAGYETEFGYFSLQELSQVGYGLPIERDRHFKPTQIQDLPVYGIERVAA